MMMGRVLHPMIVRGVTAWALVLGLPPSGAQAMPTPPLELVQPVAHREAQIDQIMQALARPAAKIHLRAMGIRESDLRTRLARLDDAQLASVAEQAEAVKAAGVLGLVIALLVIAILIVVLIALMDKKVEIKDNEKT